MVKFDVICVEHWDSFPHLVMVGVVFHWQRYNFLIAWAPHLSLRELVFVLMMRFICLPMC